MNYKEQYKDPRWQKKRLKVLERDEFTCFKCGSKNNTLHVHHNYYLKDHNVWEYPDSAFNTLCEDCHSLVKHYNNQIEYVAILMLTGSILNKDNFIYLDSYLISAIASSGEKISSAKNCLELDDYSFTAYDIWQQIFFYNIAYNQIDDYILSCLSIGKLLSLNEFEKENKSIINFLKDSK